MCNKCGSYYQFNTSMNQQAEVAKIAFAQNLASGISQLAFGIGSLFGDGFAEDYTPSRSRREEVPEEKPENKPIDNQATVKDILTKAGISVDDKLLPTIVDKYSTILEYYQNNNIDYDEEELGQRIQKYTKGLQYSMAEQAFIDASFDGGTPDSYTIQEVVDEINKNGASNWQEGYRKAAENYIATWDMNEGDGVIDWKEYKAQRASQMGVTDINQLTPEVEAQLMLEFKILNLNGDNGLDKKEIATKIWTTAGTKGTEITYDEWYNTESAIQTITQNILTKFDTETTKDLEAAFKAKDASLVKFMIETRCSFSVEEKNVVDKFLTDYFGGYSQF